MKHIRYIPSINTNTYTIVQADGFGGEGEPPLDQHPCIIQLPALYEVADCEIPEHHQILIYVEM